MAAIAAIRPDPTLKRFIYASIGLHCILVAWIVVPAIFTGHHEDWGGPGGSVTVNVVGSVPAIPLPKQPGVELSERSVVRSPVSLNS